MEMNSTHKLKGIYWGIDLKKKHPILVNITSGIFKTLMHTEVESVKWKS